MKVLEYIVWLAMVYPIVKGIWLIIKNFRRFKI
jgi:hypothetical protein